MMTKKKKSKVVAPVSGRHWDRGTELLALFVVTGRLRLRVGSHIESRPRPQSAVLVGPPGKGKTELIERFRANRSIAYRSDLTVRGLWSLLDRAERGRHTHLAMPEFQKVFQRKLATAENCIGTLVEAMDEGVTDAEVGPQKLSFRGARLGLIGGMTGRSLRRRGPLLYEMGFLDRAAVIPWHPPDSEIQDIMSRIARGDRSDLAPIILPATTDVVVVDQPAEVGLRLRDYVWQSWPDSALRMFQRFRYLVASSAVLEGRDVCCDSDIERGVYQFRDYWDRLVISSDLED